MATPQLYDEGEEAWAIKLHLGCGGVYLEGYINLDAVGTPVAQASKDQWQANRTTVTDYYGRQPGTMLALPERHPTVLDRCADIAQLDNLYWSHTVDKILAVQVFDHLTPAQAYKMLGDWRYLLRRSGVLILSVPDMLVTLDLIETGGEAERAFGLRHLRGPQRDQWGYHVAWYTPQTLTEMLTHHGFQASLLDNFHAYPAIVVKGVVP